MAVPPTPLDADGARKQVTVLFCDVAGYTARSVSLDPEELAEEIYALHAVCARIADAHCGRIAHFLGDGVLMLFGHPLASEFDPQRAVRAGLEMVGEVARAKIRRGRAPLAIRVGIATGVVVIGGHGEMLFGAAPNLAARLQQLARPNTVVVSKRTHHLARGVFAFDDLGARHVRGFAQPVRAWRALHECAFFLRAAKDATRFVGRGDALRRLRAQHEQTLRGGARIVHLRGAAGIGKSRLMRAFEAIPRMPDIRLRILCAPEFRARAFKPIIDAAHGEPAPARAGIRRMMAQAAPGGARERALLGELLGFAPPGRIEDAERPLDALASLVINMSRRQPVSLLVEDLHRADVATLEALGEIVARARGEKLFAVFTSREDFAAPWTRAAMTELRLGGLSAKESAQLVAGVFGAHSPSPRILNALLLAGGGVPLFLEEMSWHVLRAQMNPHSRDSPRARAKLGRVREPPAVEYARAAAPLAIPDTLQNILHARLDQLGEAKHFAQLAATCDVDFRYSLLSRIAAQNGIDAGAGMAALLEAGLLARLPGNCEDRYAFRRIIFRDAARGALLEKTRRRYRLQISETEARDRERRH